MEKQTGRIVFIAVIVGLWFLFLQLAGIRLGLDLRGGFQLIYEVKPPPNRVIDVDDMMNTTMEVLAKRIDALGVRDISVTRAGRTTLLVDLPGGTEAEREAIDRVIRQMGVLEFKLVKKPKQPVRGLPDTVQSEEEIEEARKHMLEIDKKNLERLKQGKSPLRYEYQVHKMIIPPKEGSKDEKPGERYVVCENKPEFVVSGSELADAYPTVDNNMRPAVGFRFNATGARKFYELTKKFEKKRYLAIVLDGVIYSAPFIKSAIYGAGIIEGDFTRDEVDRLVLILRSGALAGKPELIGWYQMGPALGERSISLGIIAIILSVIAVLGFMAAYYLAAGIIANISMLVNFVLIAGTLAASEATFTLPGLAGLVLTIGMAVDANILIFERVREERAAGKSLRQAISTGFSRAFWTIFDANITTLITAVILIGAGTGAVKGFAVVLAIGILCTMFSALFVGQTFLNFFVNRRIIRKLKMLQIIKHPRFHFVRWTPVALTVSVLLVVGGLTLFSVRGDEKYGIEFTGGVLYQVSFHKPTSVEEVRGKVASIKGLDDVNVAAVYLGGEEGRKAGEDAEKGVAVQFLIKARIAQEGTEEKSADSEKKKGRFEEKVHSWMADAFADLLEPQPFPETDEMLIAQKGAKVEKKVLFDVVIRKPEKEDEAMKEIKAALARAGFPDSTVKKVPMEERFKDKYIKLRVTTKEVDFTEQPFERRLQDARGALKKLSEEKGSSVRLPEPFPRIESIGRSVAYNLKSKAFVALFLAMIAIIIYIAVRFELVYGVAAVIALGHDVAIALGIGMLFDYLGIIEVKIDLPVIAAFLTIIGYSLNDTIVVFDRIRENLRHRRFQAGSQTGFVEIVNSSINSCLSRTLITSMTTFIAVLILFLFGVKTLQGFTFTMLVGIVVGTYSSIYIASPILILMRTERFERKKAVREMKEAEEERKRLAELPVATEGKEEASSREPSDEEKVESPDMESYAEAEQAVRKTQKKGKKKKKKKKKKKRR